jgi:lysophospholipase L1-like esterase
MINNFKWLLLVSLTFVACNNDDETTTVPNSSDGLPLTSGTANFSNYVALGNSLTAGYTDGALFEEGQNNSWTKILAGQFQLAGGGDFTIPYTNDNIGGMLYGGTQILENRLYFNGAGPVRLPGIPTTEITNVLTGPFNNMGVPGAKSFHLLAPGYGNPAGVLTGAANPYFVRFATSPTTTVIADAMAQEPTFFSLWIGNNDVLGYATTGGDGTNPITPASGVPGVGFDGTYAALVATLTSGDAKGVVANIPYVSSIPFFTTVPYNPLTASSLGSGNVAVGQATIGQLNALLYGPLKQALTAFGAGDRIELLSTSGANPLLIKDETLTNLSAQLTAAFTPSLGVPTATFYGQVFGQARQSKSTDLVLLTTSSVIGTAPTGVPAPLDKYGITYPLQDKHLLIPSEITELQVATDAYNVTIASLASANDLAFVDANAKMQQLANGGVQSNGFNLTSALVFGNAFSLDGVHPTSRGYAFLANEFVKAINSKYGSNLPLVNIGNYNNLFSAQLP